MQRRLAAIFALDMVGYSHHMEGDEEGTLARQKVHRKNIIDPAISAHGGRIVKTTGDGLLVEFASAVDAVNCAAEVQRAMAEHEAEVPEERRIAYRIGLNVGDIVVEEGDIYGDGVNVAARLEALADPGGILLSRTAFNQVKNRVKLGFADLGLQSVKNISEPVHVYRVLLDPAASGVVPGRLKPRRSVWRQPVVVVGAAAVVAVAVAVAIGTTIGDDPADAARRIRSSPLDELAETEDPRRIAVLYFEPRSPEEEVPFLASGLTEALINELSSVSALSVTSRNGVALFRETIVPPDSIGRALRVGTLVDGTVALSEDRIRVNVSFVNAATGEQFGRTLVERPRAEVFELQDDLAQEVAAFLRAMLGEELEIMERRAGASNAEAWELVQRAGAVRDEADELSRVGTIESSMERIRAADSLLALAEGIAPEWVEPTIQRGWLDYTLSRLTGFEDRAAADRWISEGMTHAQLALRLQSDNPDALELRGTLQYWKYLLNLGGGPTESAQLVADAQADLRASVDSNPQQASAWSSLSHLLANQNRLPEAKLAALRSYESDPYLRNADLTLWRLFFTSFDLGDGVEAVRWCDEGQRRFPDEARFRQCAVMVYALSDTEPDVPRVWSLHEEYIALSPPDQKDYSRKWSGMFVAMALVRAGLPDSARAVAVGSRAGADLDPTRELAYWECVVRSLLGDFDEALDQLSLFLAANPGAIGGDDTSWYLAELRQDPRYQALVGEP